MHKHCRPLTLAGDQGNQKKRNVFIAQKAQTLYIDNIEGSSAEGTVRFGLDGADSEIDLNATHS
jgi:Lsr2